jgi:hypothetical protein
MRLLLRSETPIRNPPNPAPSLSPISVQPEIQFVVPLLLVNDAVLQLSNTVLVVAGPRTTNTALVEIALLVYPVAFANARTLFVYGAANVKAPPVVAPVVAPRYGNPPKTPYE